MARLIAAYLCDSLSNKERKELDAWLKASPMHVVLFKNLIRDRGKNYMSLSTERVDVEMALKRVLLRRRRSTRIRRGIKLGIGLAACILLAVLISWNGLFETEPVQVACITKDSDVMLVLSSGDSISLSDQKEYLRAEALFSIAEDSLVYKQKSSTRREFHELILPKKKTFTLSLEDGTIITLNAESRLRYLTSFEEKREVFLDGEAYFQVAKQDGKPFLVYTPNQVIRVYGTEFNVNTRAEGTEETVLVQGKVSVVSKRDSMEYYLVPNQMANYDLYTGDITVHDVCPDLYIAWRTGVLVFDDVSLDYLFRQLSHWYDFDVKYQSDDLKQARVSCYLSKDKNLVDLLNALEKIIDVKFDLMEGTLIVK